MKRNFQFWDNTTESPNNEHFHLHVHDNYEIYLFLEGDAKYVVEENVYDLEPGDMIIIKKNQLHRVYHNTSKKYRRIILNVYPDFFEENNCLGYERQFIDPECLTEHKINAATVKKCGLYDAIMRARKYSDNYADMAAPIVNAGVIEILYLIDSIKTYSKASSTNPQLKTVIEYINANYRSDITLDELEKKFYISKYHLCHIFPRTTGLTIHQYITKKRLAYAKELMRKGNSAAEAAEGAGFNSYSAFYRSYVNEYGASPTDKSKQN